MFTFPLKCMAPANSRRSCETLSSSLNTKLFVSPFLRVSYKKRTERPAFCKHGEVIFGVIALTAGHVRTEACLPLGLLRHQQEEGKKIMILRNHRCAYLGMWFFFFCVRVCLHVSLWLTANSLWIWSELKHLGLNRVRDRFKLIVKCLASA